jgi:hypothetical protein
MINIRGSNIIYRGTLNFGFGPSGLAAAVGLFKMNIMLIIAVLQQFCGM